MTRDPMPARGDLHDRVTAKIIADLEAGVRTWTRPWDNASRLGPVSRPLRHTFEPYSGVNVLLLWSAAAAAGYAAPVWMTFRQALALGGHVRKGEHGATVIYADQMVRPGETEADEVRKVSFLKAYTVFNIDQIEDLPERYRSPASTPLDPGLRDARAEAFFAAAGVTVRHGGDQAFYSPAVDQVCLPPFAAFAEPQAYYATLGHEAVHWTGHPSRLDRQLSGRFGDSAYAREELVAELGAAFLCADLGLDLTPRDDHAGYIAGWLEVLRNDKRFLIHAASLAQRAVEHLHGLQRPEPPD